MIYDDRGVTLTLTGPGGLSLSRFIILGASGNYTGDIQDAGIFPLFDADATYTVTVTVTDGLLGGGTMSFNSSSVEYVNGVYQLPAFEILSTGVNYPPPPGYVPPNPDPPSIAAVNDYGFGNQPYWTLAGGQLTVNAANGVLVDDWDLRDLTHTGLTAVLAQNPANGTVSLSSDGSFTYTPNPGFWGQDFFRYRATKDGLQSIMAVVYVAVNVSSIEARARGSSDWQPIGWSIDGAGRVPFPPPDAWVGQAVDLRARSRGIVVGNLLPNTQFAWTVQDKAVAGWTADINASHETPIATQLNQPQTTVYWVSGGVKQVQVTVTRPVAGASTASGNINIK
jgi:hypothetical protein